MWLLPELSRPVGAAIALPVALCAVLAGVSPARAVDPLVPSEVDGLVAWYPAGSPHHEMGNNELLAVWYDDSGNGHDLIARHKGLRGLFRTSRLNGHPTVELRKEVSYDVTDPFELGDYAILLVYRTKNQHRALVRSDEHKTHGIVLNYGGRQHVYRSGGVGMPMRPYSTPVKPRGAFHLLVLGRDGGRLRAVVDGADLSTWETWNAPFRAGVFFSIEYSRQIEHDANGMEIAEMIFYDRFLPDAELAGVHAHLAAKYALGKPQAGGQALRTRMDAVSTGEEGVARLRTTETANLVDPSAPGIAWDRVEKLTAPLRIDEESGQTRIYCTREGTKVRVSLSLVAESAAPGVAVRVLVLRNNEDYLPEDVESQPFGGDAENARVTIELDTTTVLAEGEYIEIVTFAVGAEGDVRVVPDETVLVLETE